MLVVSIAALAASTVAGVAGAVAELRATTGTAPVSPPRYLVLGTWYGKATPAFVDAGKAAGFNAVRVTANWGNMETTPGVIDWSVLDNQTAYVHDIAKLPLIFNIWCQRFRPDTVVNPKQCNLVHLLREQGGCWRGGTVREAGCAALQRSVPQHYVTLVCVL